MRHFEWNKLSFISAQYICMNISNIRTRIGNHRCKLHLIRFIRCFFDYLNASYLNPYILLAYNVLFLRHTTSKPQAQCPKILAMESTILSNNVCRKNFSDVVELLLYDSDISDSADSSDDDDLFDVILYDMAFIPRLNLQDISEDDCEDMFRYVASMFIELFK